ncbi:AraC-type DNA-binding protein [Alkalispirochaeta americana]|uniref:AraC-type DNA-binding protein n=1 Tax=Alkalispirochaeta americana TaxID=159291 RepID=A0A1N6SUW5_9SPIO|nr:AraC family transcriptional regulator [Alkalispirochaeta americana]SIQ44943.1 AraC-type DNA-binding protein [Alkalispirochaeta americana]
MAGDKEEQVVKAVQRMQDYIVRHLQEPITMRQLATVACYSPYHCARMFRELTGVPPFEYIRRARLTKSALVLRDGDRRILDVALDFVFDSHEGFTRAFSREFGVTPKRYAKKPGPVQLFLPYGVEFQHLYKKRHKESLMEKAQEKVCVVFTQVVERPARKLILRRGTKASDYFEYCEEVGGDVWGLLVSIKEALHEPAGIWLPPRMRSGGSEYVQGVEVSSSYDGDIPEGFEIIDLPACRMMVFQGEPYDDVHFEDAICSMQEQLKKFRPELYGYAWDKDNPRLQLEPQGWRGYIELWSVKEVQKS